MFKEISIQKKHFFTVWAVLSAFVLIFAFTSPINVDEVLHYEHAKKVLDWYTSGGTNTACLETPQSNLTYYGQSVDNFSALINQSFHFKDEYLTRHIIGATIGILLILVIGLISIEISQSFTLGIIAMLLFFVSPRPMGQLVNNLKDIPFALGYAWSILIMLKIFKSFPVFKWKHVIQLGLAIAFTNSVRIGGLVLFPYFGLIILIALFMQPVYFKQLSFWKEWMFKGMVVVFLGYFVAQIFWPYALISPIKNPIEALGVMEHYKISIRQIFNGKWIWSTALPWHYLPVWLLISIPEVVWVGFLLFMVNRIYARIVKINTYKITKTQQIRLAFILFTFLFPILYVILIDANLYSGWRQMYFIYPSMIVLSAYGIHSTFYILKNSGSRVFAFIMIAMAIYPSTFIFKDLNPDYVYFNAVTEGNKNAFGKYEYDYYWHQMQAAVNWLDNNTPKSQKPLVIATNFDLSCYHKMDDRFQFRYVSFMERNKVDYDFAVLEVNYIHPYQLKNTTWMPGGVIKLFQHKGTHTVVITKSKSHEAFMGHQAYDNKDYTQAQMHFEKAVRNDWNNLNLQTYLGKCYLVNGETKKFLQVLYGSSYVNPFYEPIRILEAEFYHRQKNYRMAQIVLEKLLKLNPRFTDALPMLEDCYKRTGETEKWNQLKTKYQIN